MQAYDVTIVGNGVLAYTTAFSLIKENTKLKIAIIGPSNCRKSATNAAGAMLSCFSELGSESLIKEPGRKRFEMGLAAHRMWLNFISDINSYLGEDAVQAPRGCHLILNAKAARVDYSNFHATLKALKIYDEPFTEVDPFSIPGFDPIHNGHALRAIYLPDESRINPAVLIESLHGICERSGQVTFVNAVAEEIKVKGSKISAVLTNRGEVFSNKVLLAAGAFSQNLIDKIPEIVSRIPRLFFGLGNALLVQADNVDINTIIRTPNRSFACGLHVVPRGDNVYYIGATNNIVLQAEVAPRMGMVNFLTKCALEQVNQELHSAKVIDLIVGHRPVTLDTFPLIGATSIDGLWMLAGTYRDGLQQSPYLAEMIVKLMLGNERESHMFSPERLPIQTMSKEEAIKCGVENFMAGAAEHDASFPRLGWENMFEGMIKKKVADIYKELDGFVLPSDFLLLLDENEEAVKFMKQYCSSLSEVG